MEPTPAARTPPGPTPLPLVGNLLDLAGDRPHQALARLASVHGPVMSVQFGSTTTVVISSHDAAREVLHGPLSTRWAPDIVRAQDHGRFSMVWLPSYVPLWSHLRAITAAHLLSPPPLDAGRAVRDRKIQELIAFYRSHSGEPVGVARTVFGTMLNIVSNAMFSEDVVTDLGREAGARGGGNQDMRDIIESSIAGSSAPNLSDFYPPIAGLDIQGQRRAFGKRLKQFYEFFEGLLDRRIKNTALTPPDGSDFLQALLELQSEKKIDRREIIVLLTDIFITGPEATAVAVEWTMAELLRNPATMAKVREELQRELGSKATVIDERDASRLPYLNAAVKEAMRLHPPVPLLVPHGAAEADAVVAGYTVKKGLRVLVNGWAVMRDEAVWPEPGEFKPERFLSLDADLGGRLPEFIPMGSGPRRCPGVPLAERTVPQLVASILHAFDWRLPDGVSPSTLDVSEKFETGLLMEVPLKAVPVPATATAE